ncbi:hypothetical protein HZB89_00400 [archaeon]|nr:hypothetical protein [archaeon]
MNKKTLMSLFIVILMVASTIAFALVAMPKNEGQKQLPADVKASVEERLSTEPEISIPEGTAFTSGEINAKIEKMLPELVITAETNEAEIYKINALLAGVQCIKGLNPSYRMPQGQAITKNLI